MINFVGGDEAASAFEPMGASRIALAGVSIRAGRARGVDPGSRAAEGLSEGGG
jgi:hypothetical protein